MAHSRALHGCKLRAALMSKTGWNQCWSRISTAATDVGVRNEVKSFEEIPGPKGIYQWPLIGTALHYKPFTRFLPENTSQLFDQMLDKYGPIVKCRMGGLIVMISDPKDMETVFRNEGRYPVRPPNLIQVIFAKRNNQKQSFVDMTGEAWHAVRAPLNKRLMKVDSAQHYLVPQNQVADDFVHALTTRSMTSEELSDFFFCYSAESIGVVCFNTRVGFLDSGATNNSETSAFLKASKDIFFYLNKSYLEMTYKWFRSSTYRGFEKSMNVLQENTRKHLKKAIEVLEAIKKEGTLNKDEPNLLLSLLNDATFDFESVQVVINTLYVAGTASTAKNLQTILYSLAVNQDKQEILRTEIKNALDTDKTVTAEKLAKLPYLKACLKECFRLLYPVTTGPRRKLPTDVVLSGYRVPAGITIAMHNPKTCKEYFVNADKFIPERWLRTASGNHEEKIPKIASLPFGHGPKNCIGRRFAEQEIYLAVIKVLQNLRVDIDPESANTKFIHNLVIQPEKPIKFKFSKLTQ